MARSVLHRYSDTELFGFFRYFFLQNYSCPSLGVHMTFERVLKSRHTHMPVIKWSLVTIVLSAGQQSPLCCFPKPQQLGGNCEDRGSVYVQSGAEGAEERTGRRGSPPLLLQPPPDQPPAQRPANRGVDNAIIRLGVVQRQPASSLSHHQTHSY